VRAYENEERKETVCIAPLAESYCELRMSYEEMGRRRRRETKSGELNEQGKRKSEKKDEKEKRM
jgi:hypothetical protein